MRETEEASALLEEQCDLVDNKFRRNSNVLTGSGQNPATISDMAEVESSRNMEHLILIQEGAQINDCNRNS